MLPRVGGRRPDVRRPWCVAPPPGLHLVLGVATEGAVQVRVAAGEDDRAREDVADGDLVRVGVGVRVRVRARVRVRVRVKALGLLRLDVADGHLIN